MPKFTFKRKIYAKMLEWKSESKGRTALLIEGARRIGKSTIVEEFAQREYETYILIDFNKASEEVKSLFDDLMDLDFIFLRLQAIFHKSLKSRNSVIIFDEVQKCPNARQAIKYLVADGRYDYIETGSLISIKKNTESITIPSEEDRLQMYPMDFEEFRWAMNDDVTIPTLSKFFERKLPLGAAFRTTMRGLRLYALVGGMPQAVVEYLETNDLRKVDAIKRKIIKLYTEDFLKLDPSGNMSKLFESIPAQLSRGANRYVTSSIIGKVGKVSENSLLQQLEDSKTVNVCYHCDDPNVGMALTQNQERFKLFVCDTGLFVTLAFWDKNFTENVIYERMLSDKLSANLGYVYENLVAQMLTAKGDKLFYHTWAQDEKHNYEIDFILSRGKKICPIEVKSSGYRTHASLDAFCKKFSERIQDRYLIYTKDLGHNEQVQHIPTCFTMFI
ncbi:ATPase [Fibrobacter sp. UWB1]|uniref:ATP-binding protein n=1 Tax=Fibrobacter sp. UWB1 TaxID=1964355 RepID=UPI000B524AD2|nr:AAA family ATPase [Fibrobacter sp. UWB1]OWV23087.1 ATPase [Fibrobacter sp. UWB1]